MNALSTYPTPPPTRIQPRTRGIQPDRSTHQLFRWLTNDTYPVRRSTLDLVGHIDSITLFVPAGS